MKSFIKKIKYLIFILFFILINCYYSPLSLAKDTNTTQNEYIYNNFYLKSKSDEKIVPSYTYKDTLYLPLEDILNFYKIPYEKSANNLIIKNKLKIQSGDTLYTYNKSKLELDEKPIMINGHLYLDKSSIQKTLIHFSNISINGESMSLVKNHSSLHYLTYLFFSIFLLFIAIKRIEKKF